MTLVVGDGSRGLAEHAPYDAINVAAAAGAGSRRALEEQLAPGGRLVAPVEDGEQRLVSAAPHGPERMERARSSSACASCRWSHHAARAAGSAGSSRPTFAHGRPSTITTSAVKSLEPRISDEPTP